MLLPRSTPEAEGVSSALLGKFIRSIEELDSVHSVMIMRHGKVIAEGWKRPYAPEVPHMLFSLSKSFTSCAVGFACAEGKLSLDDRVIELLPDKVPAGCDPKFQRLKVRHLLSMTSGHDHCAMDDLSGTSDWQAAFFRTQLAWEPGTHFCYNSGASYMLSAIVRRATGENLTAYLRPRLLDPLGIQSQEWDKSPEGIEAGGWGYRLTTEEIAAFAQCLLDHGKRNGRQIIPPDYLDAATSVQSDNSMNDQPDWKLGYGFQFWRSQHNAFRGDGACGQYALVMPDQQMALSITSGLSNMQSILDRVWARLLPIAGSAALPENPAALAELRSRLDAWSMPVLSSPGKPVAKREFLLAENVPGFKKLAFSSTADHAELTLDGETLRAGYGKQLDNCLRLSEDAPLRMAASACWNSDEELEILCCCYETPFQRSYKLGFRDGGVTLSRSANLYFRTKEWPEIHSLQEISPEI